MPLAAAAFSSTSLPLQRYPGARANRPPTGAAAAIPIGLTHGAALPALSSFLPLFAPQRLFV